MDSQVLVPGFALFAAAPPDEEGWTELRSLLRRARQFSSDASGTTMDQAAKDFYQAAEAFAAGDLKYEKVRDIPLSQAAMHLSAVANLAPPEEEKLAFIAQQLESDASILVLEEKNTTLVQSQVDHVETRTCMQWLLACISGPSLPLHRHEVKRQEKLAEKRQVIFGISLSTPIALLTTMKAGSVLPPEHTAWVGGVSATIWVLVNAGFMMSLYGKTQFELCAAQHLSRLGMLGLAILVCFYMYWWFFPSIEGLFWVLIGVAAFFHCMLWLVGCCRHDDDSTFTSPADEDCMCSRCTACSCACRQADLESSV